MRAHVLVVDLLAFRMLAIPLQDAKGFISLGHASRPKTEIFSTRFYE